MQIPGTSASSRSGAASQDMMMMMVGVGSSMQWLCTSAATSRCGVTGNCCTGVYCICSALLARQREAAMEKVSYRTDEVWMQ